MNAWRWLLIVACVASLIQVGGCSDIATPVNYESDDGQFLPELAGPGLVANSHSPIPDAPMPLGFVFLPSRSQASITPAGRSIDHLYQGRASKLDTARFYRQQLLLHGWQFVSEDEYRGVIGQRFVKGFEDLEVRINDPEGITTLRVRIHPNPAATSNL